MIAIDVDRKIDRRRLDADRIGICCERCQVGSASAADEGDKERRRPHVTYSSQAAAQAAALPAALRQLL